jgi:acyl transferase domain-containing protein
MSFDNSASGFGRGEGIGCIILKKLDDAIADGDRIRAVIRNTGMNQDGRTQGISMPNGAAQAELIRSVYDSAGLDPAETGYVEAHGTGTKVGDPIEASALHSVFGEGRSAKDPLYVGSIKSNVGHAEGSSGILAIIKTALMLEKGFILPNINFKRPNEAIPLGEWGMKVCMPSLLSPSRLDLTKRRRFRKHSFRGLVRSASQVLITLASAAQTATPYSKVLLNHPRPTEPTNQSRTAQQQVT